MNQCPNCGKPVTENARFCPNCGAAQPSAPPRTVPGQSAGSTQSPHSGQAVYNGRPVSGQSMPSPEKKGGGKVAAILAAVAAVAALVVLGVMFLPRLFRSPEKEFVSCQQEALAAPLLALLESKVDIGGPQAQTPSTDMTLTLDTDYPDVQTYLDGTSLVLKVDSTRESFLLNGEVNLMGSPVLSGVATYEGGRLGFCLPELDENYYVMDLARLASRMTGVELDLDGAKLPEVSGKEWAALLRTYLEIVDTAVTKDNVTLEKRQEFTLQEVGGFCTGDVYTYTPTAADVEATINKLADHLEQDKELRSLILKTVDEQTLMASLENRYDSLDGALAEAVAYLRANAAGAGKAVEDDGFIWKLYLEDKAVRMIRWEANDSAVVWEAAEDAVSGAQALYASTRGETMTVFRHDYRKDGEDRQGEAVIGVEDNKMTVSYKNHGGSREGSVVLDNEGEVITVGYQWEKTGHRYRGSATMTFQGETVTLDCRWDDENRSALGIPYGSYALWTDVDGEEIQMTMEVAKGTSGGTDHVLTLRGEMEGMTWVSLNIHTTDGKSTAVKPVQAPTDITDWSEDELEELWNGLGYKLYGQFIGQVGSLFYGA